jgi:hypothetical protein
MQIHTLYATFKELALSAPQDPEVQRQEEMIPEEFSAVKAPAPRVALLARKSF